MTTQTHISCKTAKALKVFLQDSAPEPMGGEWHRESGIISPFYGEYEIYPAYQLHDLLSKPFCEAMAKKGIQYSTTPFGVAVGIMDAYYKGGIPAVEGELMRMMGEK